MKMALRLRVREVAEARGWKLGTLQRKSGISMTSARRLWYGTTDGREVGEPLQQVHLPSLEAIARELGVRPLELFEDTEDKT
jgi:DNA-binding Xre family transcriptional regulator